MSKILQGINEAQQMDSRHSSIDPPQKPFKRQETEDSFMDRSSEIMISDENRLPAVPPQFIETLFKGGNAQNNGRNKGGFTDMWNERKFNTMLNQVSMKFGYNPNFSSETEKHARSFKKLKDRTKKNGEIAIKREDEK